jgi:glycosyltransferase involved in cell wall biosynthesis
LDSLKILFIGKIPPIQGGTAKNNFWLMRSLAQRGHQIFVTTNAFESDSENRIYLNGDDFKFLSGTQSDSALSISTCHLADRSPDYLPYANPFVSTLLSSALDSCAANRIDVIHASYLEPYGVAACMASIMTGIPMVFSHAGSDLYYMTRDASRRSVYRAVFDRAGQILTNQKSAQFLRALGISKQKLSLGIGSITPWEFFNANCDQLDFDLFLNEMADFDPIYYNQILRWPKANNHPSIATVGIYGKLSKTKGTYALLEAIENLHIRGIVVRLVIMGGGPELERVKTHVAGKLTHKQILFLPYLPHWKVPSFIRGCDIVAFLENRFWLSEHTPIIPLEVMSCGGCLLVAKDSVNRIPGNVEIVDRENASVVDDPENILELTSKLEELVNDHQFRRRLGQRAVSATSEIRNNKLDLEPLEAAYKRAMVEHS